MELLNKSEALLLAKQHEGKSEVIYVASDSNVFFKEQKDFCIHHCNSKKIEMFDFTASDLLEVKAKEDKPKKTKD